MKKILIATAIAVLGATGANAADIAARPYTKAPAPVPVYNWSGFYIGANVGGKWADTDASAAIGATTSTAAVAANFGRTTSSTVIGGGQIGWNWQAPGSNWVFGLEADADAQKWSRSILVGPGAVSPFIATDTYDLRSTWQASARGRIGYAWDRWLVYGTGGVAFTEVRATGTFPAIGFFPASAGSSTATLVGGTAGGGVEYALNSNWSAGVEGRYSWYGNHTFNVGTVAAFGPPFLLANATQSARVETGEVTFRLNYKFGGPIVAKY